jgi:membrane protease YdiL (CAAX protease family)
MLKRYFENSSLSAKVFQLIGVFFILMLITLLVISLLFQNDLTEIGNLKIAQLIQSVGLFVIPPLIMAYLWSSKPLSYLQLNRLPNTKSTLYAIVIMLIAIPFINLLAQLNQEISLPAFMATIEAQMKAAELQIAELTEKMLYVKSLDALAFNILLIAIMPAIGEELFFRGIIQKILSERRNIHLAIWISAFIFSAIHLQFYGFFPRLLLGAFLGYLLFWSGNLWLPIIAHFTNNAVAVVFYYLKFNGVQIFDFETIGSGNTWWLGVISGILVIIGVYFIRKQFLLEKRV